jgi:hypothetical protein
MYMVRSFMIPGTFILTKIFECKKNDFCQPISDFSWAAELAAAQQDALEVNY